MIKIFRSMYYSVFNMKISENIQLAGLSIGILLMNFYIFFFFPPTEGWWQTYGFLVNKGLTPYIDFYMAFPPLFIFLNALLLKMNSYYIFYRIVGVIEIFIIFFLIIKILKNFYHQKIAYYASFFTIYLMMNIHLFIPNDYHTFVNLLTVLSLYLYLEYRNSTRIVSMLLYMLCLVIALNGLLFVKQNVGLIFSIAILIILLIEMFRKNNHNLLYYVTTYIIVFGIISSLTGLSLNEFLRITLQNDSKGSLVNVIFNFLINETNRTYLYSSIIVSLLFVIMEKIKYHEIIYKILLFISLVTIASHIFDHQSKIIGYVVIGTVAYLWIKLLYLRKSIENYDLLFIFFSLVYANSLTADITMIYLFVIAAFFIAEIITYYSNTLKPAIFNIVLVYLVSMVFAAHMNDKFKFPYHWWANQSNVKEAKYQLPYNQLKYIYVDKATFDFFEIIKNTIDRNSIGNDIYVFPSIPIFYQLHNKLPMTKNPVQWFDVITNNNMKKEIVDNKKQQPNLVIIFTPTALAYNVHEQIKNAPQLQSQIPNYYNSMVVAGKYKLIKYQIYNNDIFGSDTASKNLMTLEYQVINPSQFNKLLTEVNIPNVQVTFNEIISNGKSLKGEQMMAHRIDKYDRLVVTSKAVDIDIIAQSFGPPDDLKESLNALKIYKKI